MHIIRQIRRAINQSRDPRYKHNRIGANVQLSSATLLEGDVTLAPHVRFSGTVRVGRYSTVDSYAIIHGGDVTIGRYTQIGPHVGVYAINHAMNHVTIYNNQRLFEGRMKQYSPSKPVTIGSDVWIGYGAAILPGVTVGDGAVIGAGAVVTKNVEPYAIVVGSPAQPIGKRFRDEVITLLCQWRWWDKTPAELAPFEPIFHLDLTEDSSIEQLRKLFVQ